MSQESVELVNEAKADALEAIGTPQQDAHSR